MAIVIFAAAIFAILFFLLGIVCKGLAAVFSGLVESISFVGSIGIAGGTVTLVLYLVYVIVNGIVTEGLLSVIGVIFLFFLIIGFIVLLVGWLGEIVAKIIPIATKFILHTVSVILESVAGACEWIYGRLLNKIIKQLEIN